MRNPAEFDIAQPTFESSPLTRRLLLRGAAACAATAFLPGAGAFLHAATLTSDSNPQPIPSGTIIDATLTVTSPTAPGAIGERFAGLSYEKSTLYTPLFSTSNTDLIALFKLLGSSVVRIGGNSVDQNVWTPNGLGQTAGQIAPSDVDSLAAFVKAAGWRCLYGINLGGSATGATNTTLAAEEAAYVYSAFGNYLLGIEIGNEPDLYGQPGHYYAGNWSLSDFEALWGEYRTAILDVTPDVPITGPADEGDESTWTVPFGQDVKGEISLLTQHYYRANGALPSSTAANMVTADPTLVSKLAILNNAQGIGVPFRISECNSYYGNTPSGIDNSYASSLWAIDFLVNCAQGGAVGTNFHSPAVGSGYAPIAFSGGTVTEVRPEYYGLLFFTLVGQGTFHPTSLSGIGSLNVTAYAVKNAAGPLYLVISNKDSSDNLNLSITVPRTVGAATLLEMTQLSPGAAGPSLTATSGVTIQGASVNLDGSFAPAADYTLSFCGDQLSCYVPALSAVLIEVS